MNLNPPPPPHAKTEVQVLMQDGSGTFPQKERETGEYILRAKQRFNKRMQVLIIGENGQQFRTHSRDVSVGGIFVEDSLPDWVAGYFKVRLSKFNSKKQIELTCHILENQMAGSKDRLGILPLESIEDEKNLEMWFAA
jgi:hypothetical protein